MTQPFADTAVLFRFVPTEAERHPNQNVWWTRATEYVLTHGYDSWDFYYYAKCDGKWEEGHSFCEYFIARLLAEREAMQKRIVELERDFLGAHRRHGEARHKIDALTAELECYQKAIGRLRGGQP